jgi:cell shape-determining protein MreC
LGDLLLDGEEALLVELEQLRLENKQLREELAELSEASAMLADVQIEPVRARVMAVTGTSKRPTLLIARGSFQGVGAGMTVVSRRNLVGRIVGEAGPTSATVEPVWAGVSSLAVVIHTSEGVGGQRRVEARANAGEAGVWTTQLAADVNVQPGDAVTLNDEIAYLDAVGYTLGVVDTVEPEPQDPLLLKHVTVRAAVPFTQLGRVVVLVPAG